DPVADEMADRRHAGALGWALCGDLVFRSLSLRLSERRLVLQSLCLAAAVRVRRLVRARRRAADVAHPVLECDAVDVHRLSRLRLLRRHDRELPAAARLPDAEMARAVDVPGQQDRPRRAALCALPGPGGDHGPRAAEGLGAAEIGLAATFDPLRPALP